MKSADFAKNNGRDDTIHMLSIDLLTLSRGNNQNQQGQYINSYEASDPFKRHSVLWCGRVAEFIGCSEDIFVRLLKCMKGSLESEGI